MSSSERFKVKMQRESSHGRGNGKLSPNRFKGPFEIHKAVNEADNGVNKMEDKQMFTEMKALICVLSALLGRGGGMITPQARGERLLQTNLKL